MDVNLGWGGTLLFDCNYSQTTLQIIYLVWFHTTSFLHSYSLVFIFAVRSFSSSYQVWDVAASSSSTSSPLTSSTTYTPPSLRIQLWLSPLSHISAHQIVVNRFAFTLVYGMGITSRCRSGCGRLDRNPSSKCVRCILDLLYGDSTKSNVFQWQV